MASATGFGWQKKYANVLCLQRFANTTGNAFESNEQGKAKGQASSYTVLFLWYRIWY